MEKTRGVQGRWNLSVCTVLLSGVVLGGVFVFDRLGVQRSGDNPMNDTRRSSRPGHGPGRAAPFMNYRMLVKARSMNWLSFVIPLPFITIE